MRIAHQLFITLAFIGTHGCVIPADVVVEPVEVNYPPFFDPDLVDPQPNQIITFDPEINSEIEFRVTGVSDPNTDDRLTYRWFVNPNEFSGLQSLGDLSASQSNVALRLPINPCNFRPLLSTNRVELIVADRPFLNLNTTLNDGLNPAQRLPDDALFFRITWFINVINSDACPQ